MENKGGSQRKSEVGDFVHVQPSGVFNLTR